MSPIKSLFSNMNIDKDGTGDESTLVKRRPNDSEFLDLDAKIGKSGIGEVKTLSRNEATLLDFKEFNYDNCLGRRVCGHCAQAFCIAILLRRSPVPPP